LIIEGEIMRKPFIAGNWKMNKTASEARVLVTELLPELKMVTAVERVVCPPFTSLMALSEMLANSGVGLGAQDMFWETSGAFTGEVSPAMLKEFCQYVILGHSERRAYFAETDETVNKKTKAALNAGLIPIVCVGETLEENESGRTQEVVSRQILEGLKDISAEQAEKLVVAYEPVWAIGTGKAATGDQAEQVIRDYVRGSLKKLFGEKIAEGIRILYGGSVKAANAEEFFGQPDIDGALVGGASLKAADFMGIVKAAVK
jgi:triosephosphate isomerase (TIM)